MWTQSAIVVLLVTGCAGYAAWSLLPAGARQAIARTLLRLRLPKRAAALLRKQAEVSKGCSCEGCDKAMTKAAATTAPQVQTLRFHPRLRRSEWQGDAEQGPSRQRMI